MQQSEVREAPPGYRFYTIVFEDGDGGTAEEKYLLSDAQYATMNYVAETGERQSRACDKRLEALKVQYDAPSSQWNTELQKNHPVEMAHLRCYQENLFEAIIRMATELDGANRVTLSTNPSTDQLALAKKVFSAYDGLERLADPFAVLFMPEAFRTTSQEDAPVGELV